MENITGGHSAKGNNECPDIEPPNSINDAGASVIGEDVAVIPGEPERNRNGLGARTLSGSQIPVNPASPNRAASPLRHSLFEALIMANITLFCSRCKRNFGVQRTSKQILQSDRYRLLLASSLACFHDLRNPPAEVILAADDCGTLLRRGASTKGVRPRGSRDLARERGTRRTF
jgi:hypothetical protein